MKTSLLALCLLNFTLASGCKSKDDAPPDPLASRIGFCQAWAEAACSDSVVMYCNVPKVEDCRSTQSDFCLGIIPENYASAHAQECLDAVRDAYADADLTSEEIPTVLRLATPCDRLSSGTSAEGESCDRDDDCDTSAGAICIRKLGAKKGTCGEPEEVPAGDPCDGPAQVCADGYFCNGENCVAYKNTGKACDGDYMCKPEDHCVIPTEEASGTCEKRADLSEECSSDDDCQSHYCDLAPSASQGLCASTLRLSTREPLCDNLR